MPRKVKIAVATSWRTTSPRTVSGNVERALAVLELAATDQPGVHCLPETFNAAGVCYGQTSEVAEPIDGRTVRSLQAFARGHRAWIVGPIHERRGSRIYNSAVLIDREGRITGVYEKRHPTQGVMERGVVPGCGGIPVFETDFGRVAIQICFDVNWPEGWREARRAGAEIIFWPSAYEGGWPLRSLAFDNQVYVAAATSSPTSWIVDVTGEVLASTGHRHDWVVETVDLEKRLFHVNCNDAKVDAIVRRYGDRLRRRWFDAEGYFTLESTDVALPLGEVIRAFELETMETYLDRMTKLQERALRQAT